MEIIKSYKHLETRKEKQRLSLTHRIFIAMRKHFFNDNSCILIELFDFHSSHEELVS